MGLREDAPQRFGVAVSADGTLVERRADGSFVQIGGQTDSREDDVVTIREPDSVGQTFPLVGNEPPREASFAQVALKVVSMGIVLGAVRFWARLHSGSAQDNRMQDAQGDAAPSDEMTGGDAAASGSTRARTAAGGGG